MRHLKLFLALVVCLLAALGVAGTKASATSTNHHPHKHRHCVSYPVHVGGPAIEPCGFTGVPRFVGPPPTAPINTRKENP